MTTLQTCQHCERFDDDPASLEAQLPGIRAFGSAYSSSMGRAGICQVSDRLMDPIPAARCPHFIERKKSKVKGNPKASPSR
jgi:hypothetical protein